MNFDVKVFNTPAEISATVAAEVLTQISYALKEQATAELVLTGGTLGIAVLRDMHDNPLLSSIDWNRVHIWWGDERFVEIDSEDRNDLQAVEALLKHISIPASNIHFPETTTNTDSVELAAETYATELIEHFGSEEAISFDALLLGVGPDGHIASLFPGKNSLDSDKLVIFESDSPKPPPVRISMSFKTIAKAKAIWAFASGKEKSDAIEKALTGALKNEIPLVGVFAKEQQFLYLDKELVVSKSTFPSV